MPRQRIRSILVATDLGDGSAAIIGVAASLATRTGADLHALHSLELPWTPSDDVLRRTGFQGQSKAAEQRLHEQVSRLMPEGMAPASEMVIIYVAHKAILDRSIDVSADVIVLGRHSGGALRQAFLGTTTDRVVRSSEVPCLIVGEDGYFPVRRIGVATDFSESSSEALNLVLSWAGELMGSPDGSFAEEDEIRVVHVAHPMILAGDPDFAAAVERQLAQQIDASVSVQRPAHAASLLSEILWADDPSAAISDWVQREQIGLLVLGTHGQGRLKRALIGSLALSMARIAPCPVLLVPPSPGPDDSGS